MLKRLPAWVKLYLKLLITGLCLWYVGQKIDWVDAWRLLSASKKLWLLAAFIFFIVSKLVSAVRLNLYFANVGVHLGQAANLRLYWLGMYYNLFLPGGIGGDAYKVFLLKKMGYANGLKSTGTAVLLDRVSGVAGLGVLAVVCFVSVFATLPLSWFLLVGLLPALWIYAWGIRKFFKAFYPSFFQTLYLGVFVQLLQMIAVWCIMQSIDIQSNFFAFQLLFLLSSLVAILPFTVGGLGARELVFLWGAAQFGLQQQHAVYISLVFYVLTVAGSLAGLLYVFRPPLAAATGWAKSPTEA
jgi:glycosyltransferase 2 family protein